ncbi:MAG: HAD-IC family P-type ATPase [Kineosporiaceae bacterium]
MPPHEVVLLLETHPQEGLSSAEASRRLDRYGPNVLPRAQGSGVLGRVGRQFHNPLIYVLLVAGGVTVALGELVDATVIFGVVLVNAVVGFVQESKAEAALDALRLMVRTKVRVRRDGQVAVMDSEDLVPGDVVILDTGDKVPADLRLIEASELQADESALTGESVPVAKDEVAVPADTPVADRRSVLYSGTLITHGTGRGVVVATGGETELGEIHRLVGAADPLATPLTRRLTEFSRLLTAVILGLAALTFAVGLARGQAVADMFTASVALAVGAIPEGLPAAVTIILAIGVSRMARRRAVVRRLPVVETLGSTTVICTDKTGTLTENQMTVGVVLTPSSRHRITGTGYEPAGCLLDEQDEPADVGDRSLLWCLRAGMLCNDADLRHGEDDRWSAVGDPTEAALLVAGLKAGLDPAEQAALLPRTDTMPFSSERQWMATVHTDPEAGPRVLAKGSAERILDLCSAAMATDGTAAPLDREHVQRQADALAAAGLRVLATATAVLAPGADAGVVEERRVLTYTGLQAMQDPPRPAAIGAVTACRSAGVTVVMITGDHAGTASAIASAVGILDDQERPGAVLTGTELDQLPDDAVPAAVDRARVFARVTPEQKLRLVTAMQERDHVVAMTGDGVNDAPALRRADIGVAMGRSGTDVAKESADMVLTDDDFTTIEAAVEEGRGVFDNLTKFIVWTLPTNMGEGAVILVAITLGFSLPILPVQILWINMTTAVLLGLMLAFEPKEPGIMNRPPRDPRQPLLNRTLVVRILLVSSLLVAASLWLYEWELAAGASQAAARTAALNVFVTVEAFYLISCRSLTRSVWRLGWFTNPWVMFGLAVQAVAQAAITYLPAMNGLFQTAPIGLETWARILGVAVLASLVVAAHKRAVRGRV